MKKRALITDVDNTLFDWVDIWYQSFSAMIDEVVSISGIDREIIYTEASEIHQKHGTSEYAFLLEELPCLKECYGSKIIEKMSPAIDAFRNARKKSLKLYPTVSETLNSLKIKGVKLVAYTESLSFYTNYRFRKLQLDSIFDFLYSPPDHELPVEDVESLRKYPPSNYEFKVTQHRHTPIGELKPNPEILKIILQDIGVDENEAVYVGDSPMKDIVMAQQAGVLDAHAAYGKAQHREEYELLRSVTHWTPEDVAREKRLMTTDHVEPTITLHKHFDEILKEF